MLVENFCYSGGKLVDADYEILKTEHKFPVHRKLSINQISKLVAGYSIAIQVNGVRISLKKREEKGINQ